MKGLTPLFVMFALLGGISAAIAGILEFAPPAVKVAESCGTNAFRDEYGHCRHYVFNISGAVHAAEHASCPPDRHLVHLVSQTGGGCVPND